MWIKKQLLFEMILQELDGEFSRIGVRYMPIKGSYLILANLSQKISTRKMDDIDLLVEEQVFDTVKKHFAEHSAVRLVDNYWPFEFSFVYKPDTLNVYVEIHHQLNFAQRQNIPTPKLFERSINAAGSVRVLPCAEDGVLIAICHALAHIPFELRASLFDDIRVMCGQNGFSWERFWQYAVECGCQRFAALILSVYNYKFKQQVPVQSCTLFVRFCGLIINKFGYDRVPGILRRVIFELPFVKNPWWLISFKLHRNLNRVQSDGKGSAL